MPPLPQEEQLQKAQQAPPQAAPVPQQAAPKPQVQPQVAPQTETQSQGWEQALPDVAQKYGLQPDLLQRVIKAESAGNPRARSPKGALGLMQLMPDTAKRLGVQDPFDPMQNLDGGARELRRLLDKYQHYGKALAAYNAGEGTVDALSGPGGFKRLPAETQAYINAIMQGYVPPQAHRGAQFGIPEAEQQGPDLGRFAGYSRIGEAVLRGLRAPGTLFGAPTSEEQQAAAQPQQSLQQILETAQRTGQDPEEVARQTSGGRAAMEGGYISPRPIVDVGTATGAQTGFTGGLAQAASGLTSPSNLAQLFTAIPSKLMALVYAGQMGMDTAKSLWQAAEKYAAGDTQGAQQLLGGASVDAVMTALLGRHVGLDMPLRGRESTQPSPRETVQPAGVTQAPSPAEVQVAPRQRPEYGTEGGPQPVTTSGVTAAREVTGGRVPAEASAPIERGGPTGGAPNEEPTRAPMWYPYGPTSRPALEVPVSSGPTDIDLAAQTDLAHYRPGMATEPTITTPLSVEERARQTAARAYQEGLFPERRLQPGVSPTGMERRTQAERDYAEAIAATPPGQPTPGEQLSRDIRQARAGQPAGVSEGQALQRIMRDPQLYEQFRQSDRKAQERLLIAAKNALIEEQKGPSPAAAGMRTVAEQEQQGAQRPTGIPQAQAPTAAPARPQPLQPRAAEEPTGAPRQPLQPRQEPVRQPLQQVAPAARQPYRPLPPEQRPFVKAGEPPKAPELPAYAPAERKSAEIAPGVPATPAPKSASLEQREAWKETRREEARSREQAMKAEAPYKPKIERSAVGAALDRVLAPPGTYSGDRGAELVQAVNATKAQGPEAASKARDEMSTRSQRATQMAKWGQDILNAQDLDTALRNKLHEAELGKMEFEGGRMTAGGRWLGGAGKGEGTPTPKVVRQHPNELTAFWNRVRGNAMKVVSALDPNTGEPAANISGTPEGEASLRQYDDELRAILDQVRGNGGQFTQEQENRASTLIAGMNAIRGTAEIATRGPEARVSPTGALEFTGTKTSQALLNRFMNRPEGAHFKKPSREEIQSRVNEWNREAKWSSDIAKELGTEVPRPLASLAGREQPAQPPKAPATAAAAPTGPAEPRKPLGKERTEDERSTRLQPEKATSLDAMRLLLPGMGGGVGPRETEGPRRPEWQGERIPSVSEVQQPAQGPSVQEPGRETPVVKTGAEEPGRVEGIRERGAPPPERGRGVEGLERRLNATVDRLHASADSLKSSVSDIYKKWGFDVGNVDAHIVGGRAKGTPIKEGSDVDVRIQIEKPLRLEGKEPLDYMDRRNAAQEEIRKAFVKVAGDDVHVLSFDSTGKPEGGIRLGKEPAKVIPTTKEGGKIARADVPAHAEEVAEIRREREAREAAAEIPAPKPRKPPTPITAKPVSVPSPEAQARYEAEREKVVEKYAAERQAHQERLKEVQALRATSQWDYTPEFVDRMERYGQQLKDIEGKHEFLTKVAEARRAFSAGNDKAGHAAVTSALAMADQRLIKPQPGRMPIEPGTGATGAEPLRPGNKGQTAHEQLYNLQERIGKLAKGEDRNSLTKRLKTLADRLLGTEETPGLNERISLTNRNIAEMKKKGENTRTYTDKKTNKTVTETLQQLEMRVLKLGQERGALLSEDIPSLTTAVESFEKTPVAKAPAEVPTKIEPTTVPVYGERPAYVKGQPKAEAPKIGEKVVMPSPAPKEEGVQTRIDELQDQRKHLANLIKTGYGDSRKATELRKTIRTLENSIGIHAPAPPADVAATLEGERLLRQAKRTESRPEPTKAVYAPELLEQISPADTLHELLKGYEHTTPLVDKLLTADEKGRKPLGEAADHIARPILEALKSGDLTAGEAGHRLNRALEVLNEGRKTAAKIPLDALAPNDRATAFRKAFDNAVQIAKTGQLPRKGLGPEAGVFTLRGRPAATPAGRALSNFMRRVATKGREYKASLERNREAQNLYNRLSDLRQMNKGDVFHFMEIEKGFKGPGLVKKAYVAPGSPEEAASKATPDIREKVYNYREEQNLPANQRTIQLSPAEQRVNQFVDNVVSDNTRIIRKLAGNNAPFTMDELAGLTHRVPVGRGQTYEKWLDGLAKVSPGNVLSKFASSRSAARYVAMEDPQTGNRLVVRVSKTGKVYAYGAGQQLGADIGLKSEFENQGFRFGRATTDEITGATGRRYLKDSIGPNIAENIALRRAERIHDFVEALKQEPEFQRMSTTSKAVAQAMGWRAADAGKDALGKNKEWLPQFRNYYFEPHIAEVLEKENAKFQKGDFAAYERASNWLKRSIFWNPLMHTPNILVHWQGEKGLTGMATQFIRPSEWQAHAQAFEVLTDPVKYHQMLEAGLPLMRQPNVADATKLFVVKATQDIVTNPLGNRLAKAFGYANPIKLGRAIFKGASEITWATHDYAILQATFSRMRKNGWDLKTAADEVTKHIPNYRMPPRVWNSRLLGRIMDTPGISMFSQYHYGAFRSYGEMAKEMVRPLKPGDRARALDRMAALGAITYLIYPQLDKLAKHMTGRSTAVWRRAGSSTFVYNVGKLYNSLFRKPGPKMGVLPFAESVVTPAPVISAGIKAAQSKELTQKGQPLVGTPGRPGVAMKAGQIAAETVGAVAGYESGQQVPGKGPFQWRQFLFRLLGGRDEREPGGRRSTGLPGVPKLR